MPLADIYQVSRQVQIKRSILLCYYKCRSLQNNKEDIILTKASEAVENLCHGEILSAISIWRCYSPKDHQIIVFSNFEVRKIHHSKFPLVKEICLVDLGFMDDNEEECITTKFADIRRSIARSCVALCQQTNINIIEVDLCDYPKVMAEAAMYGTFYRNEIESNYPISSYFYRTADPLLNVAVHPFSLEGVNEPSQEALEAFEEGLIVGECQNFARLLHGPGSFISIDEFVENVKEKFADYKNLSFVCRDESWMKHMGMKSILQVSWMNKKCNIKGKPYSCLQAPYCCMEIHYEGSVEEDAPIALVGKSSFYHTCESYFNTERKQPVQLIQNVSSGASIIATILALARLKVRINVVGVIILCVHSFSWRRTVNMDHLTVLGIFSKVPSSHEERLILRDAVLHALTFQPDMIITLATQTNYLTEAFQSSTSVLYSSDDSVADQFLKICIETGERFMRLPFVDIEDEIFNECIIKKQFCQDCREALNKPLPLDTKYDLAEFVDERGDYCFITSTCLKGLLPGKKWLHLELNRSLLIEMNDEEEIYELHEITGSPTRSLIEFIQYLSL